MAIFILSFVGVFAGAILGYRGGVFFWPKLYDENGEVRFRDWKSFRAWRSSSTDTVKRV